MVQGSFLLGRVAVETKGASFECSFGLLCTFQGQFSGRIRPRIGFLGVLLVSFVSPVLGST